MTYIKFDVQQHQENIGGSDPGDSWSRDSYSGWVEIKSATISEKDSYNTLEIDQDLKAGDSVCLVWAQYSTGDSFGRDGGQYELLEVHTDYDKAVERAEHFKSVNDYSVPWNGYFEHLDFIEVEELVLSKTYRIVK